MKKVVTTKCPRQFIEIAPAGDVKYFRANCELDLALNPFVEELKGKVEGWFCDVLDKGLIGKDFVSVFIFSDTFVNGYHSLKDVLNKWKAMATPPNLSGC